MLRIFRERRLWARVVLCVLVGMLALGLIGSTIAWYLEPGQRAPGSSPRPDRDEPGSQTEEDQLKALYAEYETMLAASPDDLAVLTGSARVAAELGYFYFQEGKQVEGREFYQRAVAHYEGVLARQEEPGIRLELAEAYQALGSFEQAEQELQTVLEKDPGNVQAQVQRGLLREAWQDWSGAAEIWEALAQEQADLAVREFAQARLEMVREKLK
ncbi:MAG: tetratricopeptide repeat protein [Bacillota bacterium]|jgi:tetratricopeptide (TPR) repeat protein|nr:tetratricopeptide repeat protein [Bacillota bacterium]